MLIRRLRPLRIRPQARRVLDPQLLADERDHARWHRRWVLAQERAQHPHRPPLHPEPQPILITPLRRHQPPRIPIQAKEPLQLKRRRIGYEPAEPRDLTLRQKLDRHRRRGYASWTTGTDGRPVLAPNSVPILARPHTGLRAPLGSRTERLRARRVGWLGLLPFARRSSGFRSPAHASSYFSNRNG